MADQPDNVFDDKVVDDPSGNNSDTNGNPDNASGNEGENDLLKNILNEDGKQKYDSVPVALDALKHAQEYIPSLKAELSSKDNELRQKEVELETLRKKLEEAGNLTEIVDRLTKQSGSGGGGDQPVNGGLDEATVLKLLEERLNKEKLQNTLEANLQNVQDALKAKYGEKVKEVVASKAAELDLTVQELGELAKTKPNLVKSLFNSQNKSNYSPSAGGNRTTLNLSNTDEELTPPEKSLLVGASDQDRKEYMAKIKRKVNAKYGIEQ